MKKVRLGILGIGNMGSGHLENILRGGCPEIEVTAVCDLNPARLEFALGRLAARRAEKPDESYPDIATFADGEEMFNSGLVDAVVIAIPHYGHPDYAIKAMKAGLHVMCEKPAGVYTLQVREMMAEADKHPELKFGMMFNQRTNHIYRKVTEIMDSGELGALKRTSWISVASTHENETSAVLLTAKNKSRPERLRYESSNYHRHCGVMSFCSDLYFFSTVSREVLNKDLYIRILV